MKKKWTLILMSALLAVVSAQSDSSNINTSLPELDSLELRKLEIVALVDSLNNAELYDEDFYYVNDEGEILMNEVTLSGIPKFYNKMDEAYYYWLKKKLYNAYPYYLEVVKNYENFNDSLRLFNNSRQMKKYFKNRQKQLAAQYEEQLKGLTRTEGQILSKLVYRRTEKTTYEIIGELRGGFNAFMWETKAGLFDISLKTEFDPINVREDFFLNNLIYRGVNLGELQSEDYLDL